MRANIVKQIQQQLLLLFIVYCTFHLELKINHLK